MITQAVIPDREVPAYVRAVGGALQDIAPEIQALWAGDGIDGRRIAALLKNRLENWELEGPGALQSRSWSGAAIQPFLVDGQTDSGRSILEVEGGGALQNNRLHRDLVNAMLLMT